jgi:succinate dehydrogenase/fumarate reductase cytochrome b subunit
MNNETISKICALLCVITVVLGTLMAFALIWDFGDTKNSEYLKRGLLSVVVLFIASAVTLSVCKTLAGQDSEKGRKRKDDDVA